MKTYHYLLILAAVIGAWYFYNWRKENKSKKEDKNGSQEPSKPLITPIRPDNSENADVATVTKDEALAIAAKGYENFSLSQDMGDAPEYKWTLGYSDENGEWHNEILSKDTFDALVAAGYEADYN
jgi:hypothetical protein